MKDEAADLPQVRKRPRTPSLSASAYAHLVLTESTEGQHLYCENGFDVHSWLPQRPLRIDVFYWLKKHNCIERVEQWGDVDVYAISEAGRLVAQQERAQLAQEAE